jgi:hypothetical protein
MSRYKVLKSVAHNIGHSFTSLMNYADDDYAMGHLLRFARRSGCNTLTSDFVTGTGNRLNCFAIPFQICRRVIRSSFGTSFKATDRNVV